MTITKELIYISNKPAPIVPDHIRSLGHHLLHKLTHEHANRVLFVDVDSGRQWRGVELRDKILAVAAGLMVDYKLKLGDTVCISYHNSDLAVILTMAVIFAGGAVLLAHPRDSYGEMLDTVRKTGLDLFCCHEKNMGWREELARDLGHPVGCLSMDGSGAANSLDALMKRTLADYSLDDQSCGLPVACRDLKRDVAFITMSSGTTGQPKAIPATHFNCLSELLASESNVDSLADLTVALSFSLDYLCDRFFILCAIHSGYRAVIINGFEPSNYLKAVEDYKINQIQMGAAAFYNLITCKDLHKYDLSSLDLASPLGAKMVYLDVMRQFLEQHPHINCCINAYGTTETSTIAAKVMKPMEYLEQHDNSGKLKPGLRAKIVDPASGKLLGPMERGLCHVKGPTVFPGYLDLELGDEFYKGSAIDEDGYYDTGDICYFNPDEELFVVGRHKEMMSCRDAKKVVPQELEELLSKHPAVGKVCVMGIRNQVNPSVECPRAFIELSAKCFELSDDDIGRQLIIAATGASGATCNLEHKGEQHKQLCSLEGAKRRRLVEDIMRFADEHLGFEKQLTGGIILLDKLPMLRASTGKIDKLQLSSLGAHQVQIYGDRTDKPDF